MTKSRVAKLLQEWEALRGQAGSLRSREIAAFAQKLGRKRHNRGKEPTYVSTLLEWRHPISIPNHPGDMGKGLAIKILNDLRDDLDELREIASQGDLR
jgi:hypothetical protein